VKPRITAILGLILAVVVTAGVISARRETTTPGATVQSGQPSAVPAVTDRAAAGLGVFREIAASRMPMVVNIRTESRRQTRELTGFFDNDLLQRFFGLPGGPRAPSEQITEGAGTGFIIDKAGLILTNNHVIAGASTITVALYAEKNGEEYDARVVGRDPLTDSALIELTEKPANDLPVAPLGRSADVRPGDWVMAIGNPFNLAHTVTAGVISAIGRPFPVAEGHWQDVLQTDAAINPGNSGGPLINLQGEVIGINAAILSGGPATGNVGVGFAIPIDAVRDLLPQLRKGSITRGRLGVQVTAITNEQVGPLGLRDARGALVRMVERGGPAAEAGILPGDVIVRYGNTAVEDSSALVKMVTGTPPGTTVDVAVIRGGQSKTLSVGVGRLEFDDESQPVAGPTDTGLGMTLRELTPQLRQQLQVPPGRGGAVVERVGPASPAARAGVRAGDVVLEVNREPVRTVSGAVGVLRRVGDGGTALVLVWRQGHELFMTVTRHASSGR
jgi:serine protease Do